MYAARIQAEFENRVRKQRITRIIYLTKCCQTIIWLGEIPRGHCCLIICYGRTCEEMWGKVLRIRKKENRAITQSIHTPCLDDHQFKDEELETVGELLKVCSQIVLKCFCLARIGILDISRYVSYLAGAVTKGNKACDTRLARKYFHVGNFYSAFECRLGLFQDADFAGDLKDSNSTSGGMLCILRSRTSVPMSWSCKKQQSCFTQQHRGRHDLIRR